MGRGVLCHDWPGLGCVLTPAHKSSRQDFVTDSHSEHHGVAGRVEGGPMNEEKGADSNASLPLPANPYLSTEEVLSIKRRVIEVS